MFTEVNVPEPALGATVLAAVMALVCVKCWLYLPLGEIRRKVVCIPQFPSNLGTRSLTFP
jgi:hypothetical protein